MSGRHVLVFCLSAAAAAGCASAPEAPRVPAALQVPAGQTPYLEALATGVQIYRCTRAADGSHAWTFVAPEATLAARSGESLGRHYAGPTWEAPDGSSVVGEVRAKDPGPLPTAIPWLLLSAKSRAGTGLYTPTLSIQRVATEGGVAPSAPCTSARRNETVRVPYTASYFFYR